MKTIGEALFAKNPDGSLKSRIGTLFFKTPGLVTAKGVHAQQRLMWLAALDADRAAAGQPALTQEEKDAELAESCDLLFADDKVLIRPDPARMDLALKADDVLQTLVSKRRIRFLNTHAAKVRDALRARGENWRMARQPVSQEEIEQRIAQARVAIDGAAIYYYNPGTGTRYITPGGWAQVEALSGDAFRAQMREIVQGMKSFNRLGQREIDLFPTVMPPDLKARFRALDTEADESALREAAGALARDYRALVPAGLRDESTVNLEWRNEMLAVLTRGPNDTSASDEELIQGISPEFYRQIEWLPGGRVDDGELIFDSVYDEAERTQDPELLELCDHRVRSILFNLMRLFGTVEYVNIGRISRSLARKPVAGRNRGQVYLIQTKEAESPEPHLYVIRFLKWGVAERLDEGKDLLRAMLETNDYVDYILDRRLACRQLGMNLPDRVGAGAFTESYHGANQYNGTTIRRSYTVRAYVPGTASDKVPVARYGNPAFARRFAELMGAAAAVDLVVGRAATETGESVFDRNNEVIVVGADGLPADLAVTDQAGAFVNYKQPLEDLVAPYADVVRRRVKYVADPAAFAEAYVASFRARLARMQADYAARRRAFDNLFSHRPFDVGGSMAFRWHCVLERLAACDADALAARLRACVDA